MDRRGFLKYLGALPFLPLILPKRNFDPDQAYEGFHVNGRNLELIPWRAPMPCPITLKHAPGFNNEIVCTQLAESWPPLHRYEHGDVVCINYVDSRGVTHFERHRFNGSEFVPF